MSHPAHSGAVAWIHTHEKKSTYVGINTESLKKGLFFFKNFSKKILMYLYLLTVRFPSLIFFFYKHDLINLSDTEHALCYHNNGFNVSINPSFCNGMY